MKFNFHGKTKKLRKTTNQNLTNDVSVTSFAWFLNVLLTASGETQSTALISCFFSFHVTLGLYIFMFQGNTSPRLLPNKKNKQNHNHINNNNNWTSPPPASTGCPGPSWHNKICAIETHSMQSPPF